MAGSPHQQPQRRQFRTGFRFRPKDEELLIYLRRRVQGQQDEWGLFHDVDLYNHHPAELIDMFDQGGEKKVFLFSPRCRKYPNGERPRRSAKGGYWKASGKDRPVTNQAGQVVGTKRALSFFEGQQPKGTKSNWLMQEYKIIESHRHPSSSCTTLDEWVLCVVYLKSRSGCEEQEGRNKFNKDSPIESNPAAIASHTNMMTRAVIPLPCSVMLGSSTQSFQVGHPNHYNYMPFDSVGCDSQIIPPLRIIGPQEASMDQVAHMSCELSQCPQNDNHWGYLDVQSYDGGTTMHLTDQTQDADFGGSWGGESINMITLTNCEPAFSASQPTTQYVNGEGYSDMNLHNRATHVQVNGQTQEQDSEWWSGESMNMRALTICEPTSFAPQSLQCDDHLSHLNMQMANGSYEASFATSCGCYNNGNIFDFDAAFSLDDEHFWNKQVHGERRIIDPLSSVEHFIEPSAPDIIRDPPAASQIPTRNTEVPNTHVMNRLC